MNTQDLFTDAYYESFYTPDVLQRPNDTLKSFCAADFDEQDEDCIRGRVHLEGLLHQDAERSAVVELRCGNVTSDIPSEWFQIADVAWVRSANLGVELEAVEYMKKPARHASLSALSAFGALDDRIDYLSRIEDGWLDGTGKGLNALKVRQFGSVLKLLLLECGFPVPALFPTPDGNIEAEWSTPPWDILLEADLDADVMTISVDDFESGESHESSFRYSKQKGITEAGQMLSSFSPSV